MIDTIYIERAVARQPRTLAILERFPDAHRVRIDRYGEVFNPKAQNFRLQKRRPGLILAAKQEGHVLEAPEGYGVGGRYNFYFNHMLNCLYDCRYCFLQGMYRSAHYVLFVNYEDYRQAIEQRLQSARGETCWFFSGYDCDSLAMEPVTGFAMEFLPFFARHPDARIELRTKSTQIRSLLDMAAVPNAVVAFSFTPKVISRALEDKVPTVERRLDSMRQLQAAGWTLGLRFDPVIYHDRYRDSYRELFETVFATLDGDRLHSVSLGPFRLPKPFFQTITRLYPEEPLYAGPLEDRAGMVSYRNDLEEEISDYCRSELLKHVEPDLLYSCAIR